MLVGYIAIFLHLRKKARRLTQTMSRGLRSASDASAAIVTSSGKSVLIRQVGNDKLLSRVTIPGEDGKCISNTLFIVIRTINFIRTRGSFFLKISEQLKNNPKLDRRT